MEEVTTEIAAPVVEEAIATVEAVPVKSSGGAWKVVGGAGLGVLFGIGVSTVYRKFIKPRADERKAARKARKAEKDSGQKKEVFEGEYKDVTDQR